jgi:hypothetical protein
VQRLLADRHGHQRRTLGWTEEGLVRDYQILREEVEAVLQGAHEIATEDTIREATPIVMRLLQRAQDVSVAAYRDGQADG